MLTTRLLRRATVVATLLALLPLLPGCGGSGSDAPAAAVGVAPAIAQQPGAQTLTAGAQASFTVVATGTPPASIRWQLNGSDLADGTLATGSCAGTVVEGAATATLTLRSVPLACNGAQVRARATNGVGNAAFSTAVALTVNAVPQAPTVVQQPVSHTVALGAAVSFSMAASGVPAPAVQWQESANGGADWFDISGATGDTLALAAVSPADNGKRYRARLASSAGQAWSRAALLSVTPAPAGTLTLRAGDVGGSGDVDGQGAQARFNDPSGVARDAQGNAYVADGSNHVIRKITPAGLVSTLAGLAGDAGTSDGQGSEARFNYPRDVAVDASGNVYVADSGHTIRRITPAGLVSTLAGQPGVAGSDDGDRGKALFNSPLALVVEASGSLVVADAGNHTLRRVSFEGVVSTLAGTPGVAGSNDGPGTAAQFNSPWGLALDAAGNVYVADAGNNTLRRVTPGGAVSTVAGLAGQAGSDDGQGSNARFNFPAGVVVSGSEVFVSDNGNARLRRVAADGTVSTLAATTTGFDRPQGLALGTNGELWVAEGGSHSIRRVATDGTLLSTLAGAPALTGGDDGTGAAARFYGPYGVAADAAGNLYVCDSIYSTVRRVTPAGVVTTLAGLARNAGTADGTGSAARFRSPSGAAVDAQGNVYITDGAAHTVRRITPAGVVSTLAGQAGVSGSSDGQGSAAHFNTPVGIAVDAAGNVYVADANNQLIRKITPAGLVSTLAGQAGVRGTADGSGTQAQFHAPLGVAVDAQGNVLVSDMGNRLLRRITPAGVVSTLAGAAGVRASVDGPGSVARFMVPGPIALDAGGNLYMADTATNTLRRITPEGVVSTVLGVSGSRGVRLGADPRLEGVLGLAVLGSRQLALTTANGVVIVDLP